MKINKDFSRISIEEENRDQIFTLTCDNTSVQRFEHPEKGVYFFESADPIDDEVLLLSAGIHWDELAWVRILDDLRAKIFSGEILLRKHVCFVDGNLRAMDQAMSALQNNEDRDSRYWDADKKFGMEANANRMWLTDYLQDTKSFWSYASRRRREIWLALNNILLWGSDTSEFTGSLLHTDIHQSFHVPTIKQVRWWYKNDTEYAYGMAYQSSIFSSIDIFKKRFWDVYAWLVISNSDTAETFAGITARELNACSVTAEIGTIGNPDEITRADRMSVALQNELEWTPKALLNPAVDVWDQISSIIRKQEEWFGFYNNSDNSEAIISDFIPTWDDILIQNKEETFTAWKDSSFLFVNKNVVLGDRAGIMIERLQN